MRIEFIGEYIRQRMQEEGYKTEYFLRWKHYQIPAGKTRTVRAYGRYYVLVTEAVPSTNYKVKSSNGFYAAETLNGEVQHEHTGKIVITNTSAISVNVEFVEVIPKNK